jgi:hypothetical protein
MDYSALLQEKARNYALHFGREVTAEQLEFVERNFSFAEYYTTRTSLLTGIEVLKQYTKEGFIGRLEQAFQMKECITFQEFVRVDTANRVLVWRGSYKVDSPVTSPYYEFAMHFTEDHKIYLSVIRQLSAKSGKPRAQK